MNGTSHHTCKIFYPNFRARAADWATTSKMAAPAARDKIDDPYYTGGLHPAEAFLDFDAWCKQCGTPTNGATYAKYRRDHTLKHLLPGTGIMEHYMIQRQRMPSALVT